MKQTAVLDFEEIIMLKIAIVICSSFYLFASEGPIQESSEGFPLRRTPASAPGMDAYFLEHGNLSDRLRVRVMGSFLDDIDISENKTIELIRSNRGNSNPYYAQYDAHLITLAARNGMKDIVQAIVESNPSSLNCCSSGLNVTSGITPLDEAIAFEQEEVVRYLRSLGAVETPQNR